MGVGGAAQSKTNHAGGNRGTRMAVDQDETAGRLVLVIRIEANRLSCGNIGKSDFMAMQILCGQMLRRIDVKAVLKLGNRGVRRLRTRFQQINAAWEKRRFREPNEMRRERVGAMRRRVF